MPNTICFEMKTEDFSIIRKKKVRGKNLGLEGEEGTREWSLDSGGGSDEVKESSNLLNAMTFFIYLKSEKIKQPKKMMCISAVLEGMGGVLLVLWTWVALTTE